MWVHWGWTRRRVPGVGLRGTAPALAGRRKGRRGFRAVREGFLVFAFNARSGPIPLPPGVRGVVEKAEGFWGLVFVPGAVSG